MKILLISRKYPPAVGGMETYTKELYEGLSKLHDTTLLKPNVIKTGRTPLISLILFFVKCILFLLFKSHKYDVIHIGDLALYSLSFITKLNPKFKGKIYLSMHGLDISFGMQKSLLSKIYKKYQSLIPKAPISLYIANSEYTEELFKELFNVSNVQYVPLGTNLPDSPIIRPRNNKLQIIYSGRIIHRKGLKWFIDNVLNHIPAHLHVAGPNIDNIDLDSNKITYYGSLPQDVLFELLQTMDIGIFPNIKSEGDIEGFGLMSLEYASNGVLVLASNLEGLKSSSKPPIGRLLEQGDAKVWINTINELNHLNSSDFNLIRENSFKELTSKYTWNVFIKNMNMIFEDNVSNN